MSPSASVVLVLSIPLLGGCASTQTMAGRDLPGDARGKLVVYMSGGTTVTFTQSDYAIVDADSGRMIRGEGRSDTKGEKSTSEPFVGTINIAQIDSVRLSPSSKQTGYMVGIAATGFVAVWWLLATGVLPWNN